jgi:MFS family permease
LISAAQLMVVLDGTIVNIALPAIQSDLDFSPANLPWVVNAYTLAFGGLLLLGGRSGDLLGRRKMFMIGVGIFTLASFLGGIAQSEELLLAARVLQGVGAAIASPTALSLITTTFAAGPARNRAFGVYAAMSGAGAAIGLLLGGVLTESSWRWTFIVNVPIGILVLVLAPRVLRESERETGGFDIPGRLHRHCWPRAARVRPHQRRDHLLERRNDGRHHRGRARAHRCLPGHRVQVCARLMPFRVLANRTRAVSYVAMLIIGAGLFAMFYFLGLFIQQVLGYSAVKAGFAFLPFSFGIVAAAQLASALIPKVDPRWISGAGGVLGTIGMLGFSRLSVDSTYLGDLLPWMLVLSVGMGLLFVPLTLTAVSGVERKDSGVASAVLNTMQQVGGSIGLAVLSTVSVSALNDKLAQLGGPPAADATAAQQEAARQVALVAQTHGATRAFLVAAAMIFAAAVIILVGLNTKRSELQAVDDEPLVAVG